MTGAQGWLIRLMPQGKMVIHGAVGRAAYVEGDYAETNYHYYTPSNWENADPEEINLKAELEKLRREVETLREIGLADRLQVQAEIAKAEELSEDPKANKQSIQVHLDRASAILDKARNAVEKAGALAKALVSIGKWVLALT